MKESGAQASIFLIFQKILNFAFVKRKVRNASHFVGSCWFCLFLFALLVILCFRLLLLVFCGLNAGGFIGAWGRCKKK